MPVTKAQSVPAHADPRLTRLIRLKRLEKPGPEFWQRFEQGFRSRQLSSFVRIQPWHARLRRALALAARKTAPPATALGAIGLAILAISQAPQSEESPYFVVQAEPGASPHTGSAWSEALQERAAATYQVNLLRKASENGNAYQLMTSPATFSRNPPADGNSSHIGAQVIRAQPKP